jgi:hypothetical protein
MKAHVLRLLMSKSAMAQRVLGMGTGVVAMPGPATGKVRLPFRHASVMRRPAGDWPVIRAHTLMGGEPLMTPESTGVAGAAGGPALPVASGPTCSGCPRPVAWSADPASWLTPGDDQAKEWRT